MAWSLHRWVPLLCAATGGAALLISACQGPELDGVLRDRACEPETQACAPGYICDQATQRCVLTGTEGGGGTGLGDCDGPSDCPAASSACERVRCIDHRCATEAEPVGVRPVDQTPGDCQVEICDGNGRTETRLDPEDTPDDGNSCTDDRCNDGEPESAPLAVGESCDDGGICNDSAGCVQCVTASDCTDLPADGECHQRRCLEGQCVSSFTPQGTLVQAQSLGDCQVATCDGAGAIVDTPDDGDVPDDANDCTIDVCVAGAPTFTPKNVGTACGAVGQCNGTGQCVGCVTAQDCGTNTACVAHTCNNGTCDVVYTPAATDLPSNQQTDGDCQSLQCNGTGGIVSADANLDLPTDDGNACTDETCVAGSAQHPSTPLNSACPQGYCNGSGSCGACNGPSQCPNQGSICETATCISQTCGIDPLPSGTQAPAASQTDGDCAVLVCDGMGSTTANASPGDTPEDNNDCTQDQCSGNMPSHTPYPAGTSCGSSGACDGAGMCNQATKANGASCANPGECASGHCADGVCCASACNGTCEACAGPLATAPVGQCGPISAGEDPGLECSASQTCDGSGSCGFICGQKPQAPGGSCPAACTGGCAGDVCQVDCNGPSSCENDTVTCPEGWACEVQCGGASSCNGVAVECPSRYACEVLCTGDCDGLQLQCDTGACELFCGGGNRCKDAAVNCGGNECEATCQGGVTPSVACGAACSCNPC